MALSPSTITTGASEFPMFAPASWRDGEDTGPALGCPKLPEAFSMRLTGDTLSLMDVVSVRELRNHGGEVLDRVARGEALIVTRDGAEVAELRPRPPRGRSAADLIARRRHLPPVDPDMLRRDIDADLDPAL